MTDDRQEGKPLMARVFVVGAVASWWTFDASGLEMIDCLKNPNRGISQVALTTLGYDPEPITTLSTGHSMVVEKLVKS